MGKKRSIQRRINFVTQSPSLQFLTVMPVVMLVVGGIVVLIGIWIGLSGNSAGGFVTGYFGGALMSLGISIGLLALATNAIVGAIARASILNEATPTAKVIRADVALGRSTPPDSQHYPGVSGQADRQVGN